MRSGKDFQVYTGGLLTMRYTNTTTPVTAFKELVITRDEQVKVQSLLPGSIYTIVFNSYLYIGNHIINNSNSKNRNILKICYIGLWDPFETIHVDNVDPNETKSGFYSRVLLC